MNKLYTMILAIILLSTFFLTSAFSENAILTFRLVHPDHDTISHQQPSKIKIDKNEYEHFVLQNENYWVSKKIELDINDMNDAKLTVITPPSKEEIAELSKSRPNTVFSLEPSYNVTIILNKKGQEKFKKLTANYKMRRLAVIFEGHLLIAPIIWQPVTGAEIGVSSFSNYDDAKRLRDTIKNHASGVKY
jgi:preprotein translocase subunit SecD